jgi:hypothetical protein
MLRTNAVVFVLLSVVACSTSSRPAGSSAEAAAPPASAAPPTEGVMCTMEMKRCPDGSEVARTGPHCEFAPCPDAGTQRPRD